MNDVVYIDPELTELLHSMDHKLMGLVIVVFGLALLVFSRKAA